MRFKRNQVEQAISRMNELSANAPSAELRTKLKRLLETDRDFGVNPRSFDPERARYAFFSGKPPGSGVEVWFSEYEAFALYTAWCLLEHGWPQATTVAILRRARPLLEPKHSEILKWDPAFLFDERKILEAAQAGTPVVATTRPVHLVIVSRQGRPRQQSSDPTREVRVLENGELMPFIRSEVGLSATNFELVRPAHSLRQMLLQTTPSKRGRGSS